MKTNKYDTTIKMLGIVTATLLLIPIAAQAPVPIANAQQANPQEEDPYTPVVGTMEVQRQVVDDSLHITYTFTSEDLHKKYGFEQIVREEIILLDKNYKGPTNDKQVKTDVKLEVIAENELPKLDNHQKMKNKGLPMFTHQQWKIVPKSTTSGQNTNPIVEIYMQYIVPMTHVQGWALKQFGSVYTKYDPIDLIWDDTANASSDVLSALVGRMNGNGWSALSSCPSTDLYVFINGVLTKQTTHEYKYISGVCDQYHVRLWRITADRAIGAAHQEFATTATYDIYHNGGANMWEDNVSQVML